MWLKWCIVRIVTITKQIVSAMVTDGANTLSVGSGIHIFVATQTERVVNRVRLIDADALKHEMEVAPMYAVDMYTACYVIDIAPTVDAIEVVRCKGCIHYNTSGCADGFGWCEKHNRGEMDEHFCSYGERKDGEQNAEEI